MGYYTSDFLFHRKGMFSHIWKEEVTLNESTIDFIIVTGDLLSAI